MLAKRLLGTHSLRILVLVGIASVGLHADPVVVNGPPDQNNWMIFPFGDGTTSGEYQQIFDSSLFGAAPIAIDSLSFSQTDTLGFEQQYSAFGLTNSLNPAD